MRTEFLRGLDWWRIGRVGINGLLVGYLALSGDITACDDDKKDRGRPAASPSAAGPERDENLIACGEIKHLEVAEGGTRVLTIVGTEITVGLGVAGGRLSIDQGNDGTVEHILVPGAPDAKLTFSERDTMDVTFSYNDDPVRPYGNAGVARSCTS